jgi:hypothetical protein
VLLQKAKLFVATFFAFLQKTFGFLKAFAFGAGVEGD